MRIVTLGSVQKSRIRIDLLPYSVSESGRLLEIEGIIEFSLYLSDQRQKRAQEVMSFAFAIRLRHSPSPAVLMPTESTLPPEKGR